MTLKSRHEGREEFDWGVGRFLGGGNRKCKDAEVFGVFEEE